MLKIRSQGTAEAQLGPYQKIVMELFAKVINNEKLHRRCIIGSSTIDEIIKCIQRLYCSEDFVDNFEH